MNLKKIKDNNRKVRDGLLKNLAMAGMMGLAGITGMSSCGDDPLDDGSNSDTELSGGYGDTLTKEESTSEEGIINDQVPETTPGSNPTSEPNHEPHTKDTVSTEKPPVFGENGKYHGYNIRYNGKYVNFTSSEDKAKALRKAIGRYPDVSVTIIGGVLSIPKDNVEDKWDDIMKLL